MLLVMLKYDLNPYATAVVGTCGTVTGRLIFFSVIIPWLGSKTLSRDKETDLRYLGKQINKGNAKRFRDEPQIQDRDVAFAAFNGADESFTLFFRLADAGEHVELNRRVDHPRDHED